MTEYHPKVFNIYKKSHELDKTIMLWSTERKKEFRNKQRNKLGGT